jgi:hypothetical protein
VSPATILISYQVNRGCVVLPKSVTPSRITENLKVIPLDKSDMQFLDGLAANGKQQRVNTPLFGWDLVSCGRGDGCVAGVLGYADVTFWRLHRAFRTGMDRVTRTPLSLPLPHNQVDTDTATIRSGIWSSHQLADSL